MTKDSQEWRDLKEAWNEFVKAMKSLPLAIEHDAILKRSKRRVLKMSKDTDRLKIIIAKLKELR